jgi:hypothetical protein
MRDGTSRIERSVRRPSSKRRLYVFSPSRQNRSYQLQMDALSSRKCALNEHDIVVDEVLETDSPETELREEFNITPGQFKIVLVGKDAHVKLSAESFISCEEVIMRVDNEPLAVEMANS